MQQHFRLPFLSMVLVTGLASFALADEAPTFERDVRPLLAKRCTVCHNAKKQNDLDVSGGLALETFEAAMAGTSEHKVVVPGKASASELFRRLIADDPDERMPLLEKPLPEAQRDIVRRWIDGGAVRGEPMAEVVAAAPTPRRKIVRSLDVVLATDAKVPPKTEGFGGGGPVQVVLRVGPLPAVSALAFRGDGRWLAVGTYGEVVIWDLAEAHPALVLADVPGPVHALAFSRDGKHLAVGSGLPARSGSVRVYAVPDGSLVHDFTGHEDVVFGLAFRPDGAQLASASFDQTVRLWNLALGRPDGLFHGHSDFVYDVAYTPDGRWLLSVSKDRTIKRIDVKTLKEKRTYSSHNEDVLALAVQPGGEKFVTAGNEPQLRWWGLEDEKPAKQVSGHGGPVHQVAFSRNGKRLISAGGDSSVRLWDGATGSFLRTLAGPAEWQYAVALSDDARLAAAGGWDGVVRVWDAESGQLRATLLQPPNQSANPGDVEWLALVPSGYFTAAPEIVSLLRWRIGGAEVAAAGPLAVFHNDERTAQALGGNAVAAPAYPKSK